MKTPMTRPSQSPPTPAKSMTPSAVAGTAPARKRQHHAEVDVVAAPPDAREVADDHRDREDGNGGADAEDPHEDRQQGDAGAEAGDAADDRSGERDAATEPSTLSRDSPCDRSSRAIIAVPLTLWLAAAGAFVVSLDSMMNIAFPAIAAAFAVPPEACAG